VGTESRPSPWAGRTFRVKVMLDAAYPFKGPGTGDIVFLDRPFHPNVMEDGALCCDGLEWKPVKGLKEIARFVQESLSQPNSEHFVNPEAAKAMSDNLAAFETRARSGDKRASA
jgi:ubiquitin-protein ligase